MTQTEMLEKLQGLVEQGERELAVVDPEFELAETWSALKELSESIGNDLMRADDSE